jgi:glycosyltransferase involved in cell wall biosynthesis/SAM-dependent methyltransferase
MRPKVSVIIPVYNGESFITNAVESVQNEGYDNWECILIDDGSTDGTLAVLKTLEAEDERIKVLTQKNQGPGVARNFGIENSTGKYIRFLDADDTFLPGGFEKMVARAEELDGEAVIYGTYRWIDYSNPMQKEGAGKFIPGPLGVKELLINHNLPDSSLLIPKDKLPCPVFDTSLHYNEDWDCWLRIAEKVLFYGIDIPVCQIWNRAESRSKDKGIWKILIKDGLKILDRIEADNHLKPESEQIEEEILKEVRADFLMVHAAEGMSYGDEEAVRLFYSISLDKKIDEDDIYSVTARWLNSPPRHSRKDSKKWYDFYMNYLNSEEAKEALGEATRELFITIWKRRQLTPLVMLEELEKSIRKNGRIEKVIIAGLGQNGQKILKYLEISNLPSGLGYYGWDDGKSDQEIRGLGLLPLPKEEDFPDNAIIFITTLNPRPFLSFIEKQKNNVNICLGEPDEMYVKIDTSEMTFDEKCSAFEQLKDELVYEAYEPTDEIRTRQWLLDTHLPMGQFFMVNMFPTIVKYALMIPGDIRLADIGCAMGSGTQMLAELLPYVFNNQKKIEISGYDILPIYERYNRVFNDKVNYETRGLEDIDGKEMFDITISSNMFEHFEDPRPFIEKMKSITRYYAIIMVPFNEPLGAIEDHKISFTEEYIGTYFPLEASCSNISTQVCFVLACGEGRHFEIKPHQKLLIERFYKAKDQIVKRGKMAFFGAGHDLLTLTSVFSIKELDMVGVFDAQDSNSIITYGMKTLNPNEISQYDIKSIFVSTSRYEDKIRKQLENMKKILNLDFMIF